MPRAGVRIALIPELPKLDPDEFNKLTDLLYEALNGNTSACCEILGISRATWRRWEKEPPEWPWWNLVLRSAIKHTLTGMIGRRRSPGRKHKQYVRDALAAIPESTELEEHLVTQAYQLRESEQHLRQLLMRKGMFWDEIRKPANCGGFSHKTLRKAAASLGIVKSQEGYGEGKRSFWRLPNEDDD